MMELAALACSVNGESLHVAGIETNELHIDHDKHSGQRTGDRVVHSNPEILGGEPVFVETRVPVASLFEWLADGETLTDWLDSFPGVTREQALRVLEDAKAFHGHQGS